MLQIDPMKGEQATAVLVDFCHTKLRFKKKKIFWALPWENLRLFMWPKNLILVSEMQNSQDYTDPTVAYRLMFYIVDLVVCWLVDMVLCFIADMTLWTLGDILCSLIGGVLFCNSKIARLLDLTGKIVICSCLLKIKTF